MGFPKYREANPESHTEILGSVWDSIPKISGISVWEIFGLGSGFLGIFSTPTNT